MDFTREGSNYALCEDCHRLSFPVSSTARWDAARLIRGMGRDAQTWDPLGDMADLLRSGKEATDRSDAVILSKLSHAQCLALRALSRCDWDNAREIVLMPHGTVLRIPGVAYRSSASAIALLQAWAANACDSDALS